MIIKGVRPEHMSLLTNVGVIESLRHENHLIDTLDDAIAHARSHSGRAADERDVVPDGRIGRNGRWLALPSRRYGSAVGSGGVPLLAGEPGEIEGAATPCRHAVHEQRTHASVAIAEGVQLVEVRVEPGQLVLEAWTVVIDAEFHHALDGAVESVANPTGSADCHAKPCTAAQFGGPELSAQE